METPMGRLRLFQLRRLQTALEQRGEAGNRLAEVLADRAIISLLAACEDADVMLIARGMIARHMASMAQNGDPS